MTNTEDNAVQLLKQLFPDGRAFKFFEGNAMDALIKAIANSKADVWNDALGVLDSILPDNENFTAEDAAIWVQRLGIYTTTGVDLEDQKKAIARKLNHPGIIKARQAADYLQASLQAAGFDVYVHENIYDDGMGGTVSKSPFEVFGDAIALAVLGAFSLGEAQLASNWLMGNLSIIANHIEESEGASFGVATDYRNTFYISGSTITNPADVPEVRKTEFRQLILTLKPKHLIGFLYINYI